MLLAYGGDLGSQSISLVNKLYSSFVNPFFYQNYILILILFSSLMFDDVQLAVD
jgi:hypothetical protein